jgi:hypothetical protein
MAEVVPRIMDMTPGQNLVTAAGSSRLASSEQVTLPLAALLNQLRSDVWRSKLGWTIGAENDKLDFFVFGVGNFTATIAHGTYATGGALATAILVALEAEYATAVWVVTYAGISTHFFTIESDVDFSLKFATGAGVANGIARDIGFGAIDSSLAMTHSSSNAVYQSRQWITVDLGAAANFQAVVVANHNLGAVGTMKIQASASNLVGVGLAAAPTVNQALSGSGSALRYYYFGAAQPYRYLRLLIDDVVNSDGYTELGLWFCGAFIAPRAFQPEAQDGTEPLDDLATAANGAHYRVTRQNRDHWTLNWRFISTAERAILKAFIQRVGVGGNFFFAFDASGDPTNLRLCFFKAPPPDFDAMGSGTIWAWRGVHLCEALG